MAAARERTLALVVAIAAVVAALCGLQRLGGGLGAIEGAERVTLDLRFRVRGPRPPGDAVAIVALDDATLARAPHLLERRSGVAALVDAIAAQGASAIGLDLILADPEMLLPAELGAAVIAHVDAAAGADDPANSLLRRVRGAIAGDDALVAALAGAGEVALAFSLGSRGEVVPEDRSLRKGRFGQVVKGGSPPRSAERALFSRAVFNEAADLLGLITAVEDSDQTLRELVFARRVGEQVYMPLAAALVALHERTSRARIAYLGPESALAIGDRRVPLEGGDRFLLDFLGPAETFPTYSAVDVVEGRAPAGALAGRIVLVGTTFLGEDRTRTAFGVQYPGVELHATAIDNILRGSFLRRASPLADALWCLGLGLAAALLFAGRLRLGPVARLGGVAALLAGHVAAVPGACVGTGLWVGAIWPALAVALVGAVGLSLAYLGEARQRLLLRRTFAHYLGDQALAELLASPEGIGLGGERREVSVLFSDIRDFTAISEHLSPEALVELLNVYLTPMTRAVLERGGYLDKYIGDAVMAVYGAPVRRQDHAARALATVIAMDAALRALGPALAGRGVEIDIGVGVNTGEVVVGNMGSDERFDYTAVGDAVNLASRLEGLTKVYRVRCLVGEGTRRVAPPEYRTREVDRVRVKGKAQPVAIHELLGGPEGELARYERLEDFSAALAAYRAGAFESARASFESFVAANPHDHVAALYLERITAFGGAAPAGWDGVTVFQSK